MSAPTVDTRMAVPRPEAARLCGVSLDTIRRRLRAGAFPNAARVGEDQHWVIPVQDLLDAGLAPATPVVAGPSDTGSRPDDTPAVAASPPTPVGAAEVEVEVLRAELARAQDEIAFLRSLVTRAGRVA